MKKKRKLNLCFTQHINTFSKHNAMKIISEKNIHHQTNETLTLIKPFIQTIPKNRIIHSLPTKNI